MKKVEFRKILGLGLLLITASVDAKVFYVDRHVEALSPSGESWLSAFPSIQQALDAAQENGDVEIWVKAGVYRPEGNDRGATFQLTPGLKLYGGFHGDETALDQRNFKANRTVLSGDIGRSGSRADDCFHIITASASSRVDGFIITGGNADNEEVNSQGGALLASGDVTDFTVANCTFKKNYARIGGALYSSAEHITLTNCIFFSNSADLGGALAINSKIRVYHSIFTSNFSKQSGGAVIVHAGADAEFVNCSFQSNSSDGNGGSITANTESMDTLRMILDSCTFTENSSRQNGGAVAHLGSVSSSLISCSFSKNTSVTGGGAIANLLGAVPEITTSSFSRNRGVKGMENIGNDARSLAASTAPVTEEESIPETVTVTEPPPIKRLQLTDTLIHDKGGKTVELRSIVQDQPFTLLALGELTDPDFISSYGNVETIAHDYASKDIGFFYIYRYLRHPENNGYIQSFNRKERTRQASEAARLLHTRIPWLVDTMDNQSAQLLSSTTNTLFIFNREGIEEYAGSITDTAGLRSALSKLAGNPDNLSLFKPIPNTVIKPVSLLKTELVKRIVVNPAFMPLKITPHNSRSPYFVKLRVEASEELIKTGNGKLFLSFQVDSIYPIEWNNLKPSIQYAMDVPKGTAISPSVNSADKVTERATDSEPRDFMLECRKWRTSDPVDIKIHYCVHSKTERRNLEITQRYTVYLDSDPFGGNVLGRKPPATTRKKPATTRKPRRRSR